VEDLASLLTVDQNAYLSITRRPGTTRATPTPRSTRLRPLRARDGSGQAQAIAREFQEFSADKLYWNTISGSPFYQVAQPWMKGYVYQAEFKFTTRSSGWTSNPMRTYISSGCSRSCQPSS